MDENRRTRVLRYAYEQVLDATKHQDDKINRLLTAIAFLTGGALSVAGLHSADYLTQPYEVGRFKVPLALIAVAVFFVGVVAAVLMLVGSLTTPLRLPSVPRRSLRRDPGPGVLDDYFVSRDAQVSPIYFFEISKLSLGQWQTKWVEANEADIAGEEHDALVRETHNLAVRTEFKYTRTGEAVAVLSFALAWLAIAAVLVLVSASRFRDLVRFGVPVQISLSVVLGGYVWLQIRTSLRHKIQSVEELYWVHVDQPHRSAERFWFPILAGAVPVALVWFSDSDWRKSTVVSVLSLGALELFRRIRQEEAGPSTRLWSDRPLVFAAGLALAYAVLPWASSGFHHLEAPLVAALATTAEVLIAAFVALRGQTLKRLSDFQASLNGVGADGSVRPGAVETPGAPT